MVSITFVLMRQIAVKTQFTQLENIFGLAVSSRIGHILKPCLSCGFYVLVFSDMM